MKLTIVEKNLLSWTAMHIDFVMCKKGDPLGFSKLQFATKYQGDPWKARKFRKKSQCRKKIERGEPSVSSAFANARKSFWLKQGLEHVTAGFPVNRLKSVLKSGTYTMRSVV